MVGRLSHRSRTQGPSHDGPRPAPSAVRPRSYGAFACVVVLLVALAVACGGAGTQVPPAAPEAVTATPIAGGVRVTWTDTSDNESEFVVYRSDADAAEGEEGSELTEIGRAPGDTEFYQDFGVTMGGSYTYAVAAINQFGASDQVLQEPADPVSPAVGVRLTVTLDGTGEVSIDDGFTVVTCSTECTIGVTSGATLALAAAGVEGSSFAGWAGACAGADICQLTPNADASVEARFSEHVLRVVATGDSPVAVEVSPPDSFDGSGCVLDGGESCAFGYDFGTSLKVSINSVVLEAADGGTFGGYGGACTSPQGRFCLIDVDGETEVEIEVVRVPTVNNRTFPAREDTTLEVDADDGLLRDVSDSDGDTHTAELVTAPSSGVLELAADGSFTYEPATDANGVMTFEFRAVDAHGNESATRTVTMNVAAVNDAPRFDLIGNPAATLGNGNPVTRTGFATGVHPGGGPDEAGQVLTFTVSRSSGSPGLLSTQPVLTRDGSTATLTYTPASGVYGTAAYSVVLSDNGGTANGGQDTAVAQSFTVMVSPVTLTTFIESGQGSIGRNPSGDTTATPGIFNYGWGTNVTLTASAAANYHFDKWSGDCLDQGSQCTITMEGNRTVGVSFSTWVSVEGGAFTTVTSNPSGINCNPWFGGTGCTSWFGVGTSVTLSWDGQRTVTPVGVCQQPNPTTACTFEVTGPTTVAID